MIMRTQIANTTKEKTVKISTEDSKTHKITVPIGTEVKKVFGGIGYVDCWYVTDFSFIEDDALRYAAGYAGIPVPDDCVEFPE